MLEAGQVHAMGQNEDEATGGENEDEATTGEENYFLLEFFSWSNRRQGDDRTRGEMGMGRALLCLLPNEQSRLIGSENGWHGIS